MAQKINEHQLGEVLFRSLMHMNTEGSSLEHHLALREAETPLAASTQKQWARSVVTRFYERLNANREARMDRQDLQALFMLYPKLSRRLLFGGQIVEKTQEEQKPILKLQPPPSTKRAGWTLPPVTTPPRKRPSNEAPPTSRSPTIEVHGCLPAIGCEEDDQRDTLVKINVPTYIQQMVRGLIADAADNSNDDEHKTHKIHVPAHVRQAARDVVLGNERDTIPDELMSSIIEPTLPSSTYILRDDDEEGELVSDDEIEIIADDRKINAA